MPERTIDFAKTIQKIYSGSKESLSNITQGYLEKVEQLRKKSFVLQAPETAEGLAK
jgi:hypothetical protein